MARYLIAFLLVCSPAYVLAMGNVPSSAVEQAADGKSAAEFTLPTTSGADQGLTQVRAGKRAVLFFWATWCPHCHEELEKVRQNLEVLKQRGIRMILVDVGESKEDARAYLNGQGISLISFVDEDNTVTGQYGVVGVPTLFFLDEKGVIRDVDHEFPADYDTKFGSQ